MGFPQDTLCVYLNNHITYEEETEMKLAREILLNLDIPSLRSLKSTYILCWKDFSSFPFLLTALSYFPSGSSLYLFSLLLSPVHHSS